MIGVESTYLWHVHCTHICYYWRRGNACFCFPICAIFTRYLHNYRSASVFLDTLIEFRSIYIANYLLELIKLIIFTWHDLCVLRRRRAAIGYWVELISSIDLRTARPSACARASLYYTYMYIVLYKYSICCVLSALIGGNCWRFIAQAAAVFNATSVCSKLCPLCQQTESLW